MVDRSQPMTEEWWQEHMHTPQELRIARSGLKVEPGAFERDVLLSELREQARVWFSEKWKRKAEWYRLERAYWLACQGRPGRKRMADGFKVAPKQPPQEPSWFEQWQRQW